MIILAKNYSKRADLELAAKNAEEGSSISGTREELSNLQLDDQTILHGLKCIITDSPTKIKPQIIKIDRGEVFKSKLNGKEQ